MVSFHFISNILKIFHSFILNKNSWITTPMTEADVFSLVDVSIFYNLRIKQKNILFAYEEFTDIHRDMFANGLQNAQHLYIKYLKFD